MEGNDEWRVNGMVCACTEFTLALFDEQHDQIAVNDTFMMGIHSERIKLFSLLG